MLAEQCNRYEDMADYLEDLLNHRDSDLSSDERNLLSIAYKSSVSSRRTALRTIIAYETKEKKKENSTFLPFIQEYKKKVEDELDKMCNNVISTIDNKLIKKSSEAEAKVFYLKMKGDYYRYIAEYNHGETRQSIINGALEAYNRAVEEAKQLSNIHPISLGLTLNLSVFYYEIMNNHEQAIKIAKNTLDSVNNDLNNLDEDDDTNRDAVSIINLLRENLEMWKIEADEGN
jgi:hypothetical protein